MSDLKNDNFGTGNSGGSLKNAFENGDRGFTIEGGFQKKTFENGGTAQTGADIPSNQSYENIFVRQSYSGGYRAQDAENMTDYSQATQKSPRAQKMWTIYYAASTVAFIFITFLQGIIACEVPKTGPVLTTVLSGAFAAGNIRRLKTKKYPNSALKTVLGAIAVFLLLVYIHTRPFAFRENYPRKYHDLKSYEKIAYGDTFDFLPLSVPVDAEDFEFSASPSFGQGSAYINLRYRTDPEYIREIAENYSFSMLDGTIRLSQYKTPNIGETLSKKVLSIKYDKEFWAGHEDKAYVCVLDCHGTGNHPHSTVVIINTQEGMIEYSKLGW